MKKAILLLVALFVLYAPSAFAEETAAAVGADAAQVPVPSEEDRRRETVKYGTDAEILDLVKRLEAEKADYLDGELRSLLDATENASIRETLFSLFGRRKVPGAEALALKLIAGREEEKRAVVEAAFGYVGALKPEGAKVILREVIEEGEGTYLAAAIRALGRCGGVEDAEFLIAFWEEDTPADAIQQELIVALGEIGSGAATAMLSGLVEAEDTKPVRKMAALEALSKIGDKKGLKAILSGLSASDANVRASAVAALGPFPGEDADRAVLEAFRDSFYKTRAGAAKAAGERRMEAAVPYLRYRSERDDVGAVRTESLRALGKIGGDEAYEALIAIFENPRTGEVQQIVAAEALLGGFADKSVGKVILAADSAREKKRTAYANGLLKALSSVKSPELAATAGRLLTSDDIVDQHYGLDLVILNAFADYEPKVRELAKSKNESLAKKARAALSATGAQE